jgi:hypothetical protein
MDNQIRVDLQRFQTECNVTTKGPLALVVQLTATLRRRKKPWQPDDFLTANKGQVAGLGGGNLKKILARRGITRTLASEGGRTSRGNMGLMMKYIDLMNRLDQKGVIDFDDIENYWAEQVVQYFNNQPFTLPADVSRTIGSNLNNLFDQARKRQSENPGTQYLGALLQHLSAAKLSLVMPAGSFEIHGASVADSPTSRSGDFVIKDTVFHCTTAPGEPLIRKCQTNVQAGARPVIITLFERVRTALDLVADADLGGRVEVWDIQQFLSTNVSERSLFDGSERNAQIADIITAYNKIVDENETDPSLRIEFEA